MISKRSLEGYFLLDSGEGPAVAPHPDRDFIGVGQRVTEVPVLTCGHCQTQMIVQPMRTRDRHHCRKCDHYICDGCAGFGECLPMERVFDVALNQAHKDPTKVQAVVDQLRRDVLGVNNKEHKHHGPLVS